ncbi:MAG TPA: hypothetical protein VK509_25800 [Polyangiales bacterium]|nr:hypothetical protein [Polyangiales bacterium]
MVYATPGHPNAVMFRLPASSEPECGEHAAIDFEVAAADESNLLEAGAVQIA